MQYVASVEPENSHTHGPECFASYQFVDDGGFAEPALGLRPWMCVKLWGNGLIQSLGFKALNRDKKRMDGKYPTQALMWGDPSGYRTGKSVAPERQSSESATPFAQSPL